MALLKQSRETAEIGQHDFFGFCTRGGAKDAVRGRHSSLVEGAL